jgi:energy-coupling factor transporter ATP-binding protein EcfA2
LRTQSGPARLEDIHHDNRLIVNTPATENRDTDVNHEEDDNDDDFIDDRAEEGEEEGEGLEGIDNNINNLSEDVRNQITTDFYHKLIVILENFGDPENQESCNPELLEKWLKACELFWIPKSIEPDVVVNVLKRNLNISTIDNYDPNYVQEIVDKKAIYPLLNLQMKFVTAGMLMNSSFERSSEFSERFHKLMTNVLELCEMFMHYIQWVWNYKNNHYSPTEPKIGLYQWNPKSDTAKLNPYQKFLTYCLIQLKKKNLRRYDEYIYQPIYNDKNEFTNSWKKYMSIEKFVYNVTNMLTNQEAWIYMTDSKTQNITGVVNYLKNHNSAFFPEIKPTRYLISFKNGVYNILQNTFHSYEQIKTKKDNFYKELDDLLNFDTLHLSRRSELLKKSILKKNAIEKQLLKNQKDKQEKIDNNILNGYENEDDHFINDEEKQLEMERRQKLIDEEILMYKKSQSSDEFQNPYSSMCSINYIDEEFINCIDTKNWKDIKTNSFDDILEKQGFSSKLKEFFCTMYGRSFYNLGDFYGEKWQIATILYGVSNSGKSTILRLLSHIYPQDYIGLINNRIEKQFGLDNLFNRGKTLVCVGYEVGKDFQMDINDFKSICTGELLKISIKKVRSVDYLVKTPMIFACNVFPASWKNDGFALEKRACIFYFKNRIRAHEIKTSHEEQLRGELSKILQKTNRAYQEFATKYGQSDIWKNVPDEIRNNVQMLISESDPFKAFLHDGQYIETSTTSYVSEDALRAAFKHYCESRRIIMPSWKNTYIEPVLISENLKITKGKRPSNGNGDQPRETSWIDGIKLLQNPQIQNTIQPTNSDQVSIRSGEVVTYPNQDTSNKNPPNKTLFTKNTIVI